MKNLLWLLFSVVLFSQSSYSFNLKKASPKITIKEVSSSYYPEKSAITFLNTQSFLLPQSAISSGFGAPDSSSFPNKKNLPICGPSPIINTLNCFNLKKSGFFIKSYPIPGSITATPLFVNNSWILGTSKGFLMRIVANSDFYFLPKINSSFVEFWGFNARKKMHDMIPQVIYTEASTRPNEKPDSSVKIPENILWSFPTSSPFIGSLIAKNDMLYGLTANQNLKALNLNTGKLEWNVRLAADAGLTVTNTSLLVTDSEIYVGNADGALLSINPKTGSINWSLTIKKPENESRDKFTGIVSPPFFDGTSLVFSNVESETQKISASNKQKLWSIPKGSVTKPLLKDENTLIIGASDGSIISANYTTGQINWAQKSGMDTIVDIALLKNKSIILAASGTGKLIALNSENGQVLSENPSIGTVKSYFFTGSHNDEVCLTFSMGGFRCFTVT